MRKNYFFMERRPRITDATMPTMVLQGCAGQCFAAHRLRQNVNPESHAQSLQSFTATTGHALCDRWV